MKQRPHQLSGLAYHGAVAPLPSSAICTSACSYTSFVRAQQQVKRRIVWVRLTTGSGSLGSSSVISSSGIALFQIMLEAPGDVATLRRGVIKSCASTLVGLVETDLRVSIGGHVLEDNDSTDEYGAERDAPFDVHLAAERATEQVHGPRPDLQSAPRDSRVCSPLTNCHAPNARRLSEVIIAGQNRRHGRRSRSGSRRLCGSPARRLRESLQMVSASRGGCRLAARQTVGASLFSPPPRRRGVAGSMASCSTPATCCGNLARARATVQFTESSLTDGRLGRERLSPWYDVGYVFVCVCVCLCVFV